MSDAQHRVYVFHSLTDRDRRVLAAAGVDLCHMRRVSESPLVIETCGGDTASISYGYVDSIPFERVELLIRNRTPAMSEPDASSCGAGIVARLREWLAVLRPRKP